MDGHNKYEVHCSALVTYMHVVYCERELYGDQYLILVLPQHFLIVTVRWQRSLDIA